METDTECSSYSKRTGSSNKSLRRIRTGTTLQILSKRATSSTCTIMNYWNKLRSTMPSNVSTSLSQISKLITRWLARSVTGTKLISKLDRKLLPTKLTSLWPMISWLKTPPLSSQCWLLTVWSLITSRVLTRIKNTQFYTSAPSRLKNQRWRKWIRKRRKSYGLCSRSTSAANKYSTTEPWRRVVVMLRTHTAPLKSSRKLSTIKHGKTPMMRRAPPTTTSDEWICCLNSIA